MAQTLDIQAFYRKLAANETLTEDEITSLLKSVESAQVAAVYLADCHAATLESMPKSTSKSARTRQAAICRNAACLLDGNIHVVNHRAKVETVRERCIRAANEADRV